MSAKFNELLKKTYIKYRNNPDSSPLSLDLIKKYFEIEGIDPDKLKQTS